MFNLITRRVICVRKASVAKERVQIKYTANLNNYRAFREKLNYENNKYIYFERCERLHHPLPHRVGTDVLL